MSHRALQKSQKFYLSLVCFPFTVSRNYDEAIMAQVDDIQKEVKLYLKGGFHVSSHGAPQPL